TNPSVIVRALDYLQALFSTVLADMGYKILDYEANSLLPHLLTKIGDPKEVVRLAVKGLITMMCQLYPAGKVFAHVMDALKSKNSRQRAECLEVLGTLMETYSLVVCQP